GAGRSAGGRGANPAAGPGAAGAGPGAGGRGANPEACHGSAGARPSAGGLGAMSGPPVRMDVTTVVVSWNTREHLARCLAALEDAAEGLRVETIVVDNGSTDGSQAMVAEKFPRARLIQSRDN